MRNRRDVLKFAVPFTLMLMFCGSPLNGAVVGRVNAGSEDSSAEQAPEMLYGFPLTLRLNIGVTASIDPTSGGFHTVSTELVPFFANSPAVASHSRFLYVSNSYIDGLPYNGSQILTYSINRSDGTLTAISGSPTFPPPSSIQGLATSPGDHFLYGADVSGYIYGFSVDDRTGILTSIPGSPFASGANAQLAVDPSGKYLYASDAGTPSGVFAFAIGSSGALTPVPGSPFPILGSTDAPNSEPDGIVAIAGFVYVALSATNQVAAFSVDGSNGALAAAPGSPFPTGTAPTFLATTKKFLYVVNSFDGSTSGYRRDHFSGALTPVPGSPFGSDGGAIAVDPAGKYLYSGRGDGIQSYNIDSRTGSLTVGSEWFVEDGVLGLTIVKTP
jgi:6-phosphogluconolactonase (cycloisomerase 2 family)